MAKAFMWQLEEFPGLPENYEDLTVVLVFELNLTAPRLKWYCAYTDYKRLQERYEESKLPAEEEGFEDEGHVPFNSTEFMGTMLDIVADCPELHVTAFYWDLTLGELIEHEYISYDRNQ
jgi:hypothetical protein